LIATVNQEKIARLNYEANRVAGVLDLDQSSYLMYKRPLGGRFFKDRRTKNVYDFKRDPRVVRPSKLRSNIELNQKYPVNAKAKTAHSV